MRLFAHLGIVALFAVTALPAPPIELPTNYVKTASSIPLGLDETVRVPNEYRGSGSLSELGKVLFFEPLLSGKNTFSCATCHVSTAGYAGASSVAIGESGNKGRRKTPPVFNRTYGTVQFWDGRARSLEEQASKTILCAQEMAGNPDTILAELKKDATYLTLFKNASLEPTLDGIAKALGTFQRTLLSGDSAFDRFEWNGDSTALSVVAR